MKHYNIINKIYEEYNDKIYRSEVMYISNLNSLLSLKVILFDTNIIDKEIYELKKNYSNKLYNLESELNFLLERERFMRSCLL